MFATGVGRKDRHKTDLLLSASLWNLINLISIDLSFFKDVSTLSLWYLSVWRGPCLGHIGLLYDHGSWIFTAAHVAVVHEFTKLCLLMLWHLAVFMLHLYHWTLVLVYISLGLLFNCYAQVSYTFQQCTHACGKQSNYINGCIHTSIPILTIDSIRDCVCLPSSDQVKSL